MDYIIVALLGWIVVAQRVQSSRNAKCWEWLAQVLDGMEKNIRTDLQKSFGQASNGIWDALFSIQQLEKIAKERMKNPHSDKWPSLIEHLNKED